MALLDILFLAGWFSFNILNIFLHSLLPCDVFTKKKKSDDILMGFPWQGTVFYTLDALRILSLSLTFDSFHIMSLEDFFFLHWTNQVFFWLLYLNTFHRFGKFLSIISLNTFYVPFSLSSSLAIPIILTLLFLMESDSFVELFYFFLFVVSLLPPEPFLFPSSRALITSFMWSALFLVL